ncbi:macrophage-expressed gene 1 protein-like [Ambystoma mexicanum]|uniref:macrophage-expressed gene 1 protein-like n=1 Tax=Ambystoma mexicanum TaxID=8296 RepID=UPI0037E75895
MRSPAARFLLIWAVLALVERGQCAGAPHQGSPPPGPQECKKTMSIPTLEVLPGGGWDNLRNLDMGRVMSMDYSSCKTTEDGAYIVPDDVFVIPQKQTNLEMNSEIVASWKEYKSYTSFSINEDVSVFSVINGKFSTDFQRMKTNQIRDNSFTTRVQVRNHRYTVKANPNFMFDPSFKSHLFSIANHLENNQTCMAKYLAEILILNYGTHVLTSVDAGASLMQEDNLRSTFLENSWSQKSSITASAGGTFQGIVSFGFSLNFSLEDSFTRNYVTNRTSSRVESIGGVPFYPGITLKTWQESITNQLVAIDRSGLPIQFFINPQNLPDLPEPTVKKLLQTVDAASSRYYKVNTYPGCTDATSPNFNFQANIDDSSCQGIMTNFTFGGAYQDCTEVSGEEAGIICQGLEHKNPLTGGFSCPQGYAPVKLSSQNRDEGFHRLECHEDCFWGIFCKRVCVDVFRVSTAQFIAYWCAPQGVVPQNSGYLFGGLFNSRSINPLTTTQSCPVSYYALKLLDDLKVCVSGDYEMGYRYSVPFGGFFSCEAGNPLVLANTSASAKSSAPKRCPSGFSQHLAVISDGCQVNYCVKSGLFTGGSLPPVRLPPFSRPPAMSVGITNTVLVLTETDHSWVKDSGSQMWTLTKTETARSTIRMVQGADRRISGGEAAGITVAVSTTLAVLIAMAIYGRRRYRQKGYQELESRRLVAEEPRMETVGNGEMQDQELGEQSTERARLSHNP